MADYGAIALHFEMTTRASARASTTNRADQYTLATKLVRRSKLCFALEISSKTSYSKSSTSAISSTA